MGQRRDSAAIGGASIIGSILRHAKHLYQGWDAMADVGNVLKGHLSFVCQISKTFTPQQRRRC